MSRKTTRRQFLQTTAVAGIGFWVAGGVQAKASTSPNERIAFAAIGIGSRGKDDSDEAAKWGDMVAICDVDEPTLQAGRDRFPKARQFYDFRKMLEEMSKSIDAVVVATPDHCHAPAAAMTMRLGKHCFCEKPLSHTIYEARTLAQIARETKVATMMGNQGTAESGVRKAAALLRAKALGNVKEVHVWTNRPVWPQGGERPEPPETEEDREDLAKRLANVHWQEWLGPAPYREFGDGYHPFAWRGWWDFGTGALGDMACHTMNMPYMGLDLRNPTAVQATTSGHNKDSYPKSSVITFDFPANDWRPAVKLTWYDGGRLPDKELIGGKDPVASGCAVVGEKGILYSPNDYGAEFEVLGGVTLPEVEFEKSPGHFEEWVRAIRGGKPARANFADYAGPLTETMLLGNLAVWVADKPGEGEKVLWDPINLKSTNIAGLEPIIHAPYRPGYSL